MKIGKTLLICVSAEGDTEEEAEENFELVMEYVEESAAQCPHDRTSVYIVRDVTSEQPVEN